MKISFQPVKQTQERVSEWERERRGTKVGAGRSFLINYFTTFSPLCVVSRVFFLKKVSLINNHCCCCCFCIEKYVSQGEKSSLKSNLMKTYLCWFKDGLRGGIPREVCSLARLSPRSLHGRRCISLNISPFLSTSKEGRVESSDFAVAKTEELCLCRWQRGCSTYHLAKSPRLQS